MDGKRIHMTMLAAYLLFGVVGCTAPMKGFSRKGPASRQPEMVSARPKGRPTAIARLLNRHHQTDTAHDATGNADFQSNRTIRDTRAPQTVDATAVNHNIILNAGASRPSRNSIRQTTNTQFDDNKRTRIVETVERSALDVQTETPLADSQLPENDGSNGSKATRTEWWLTEKALRSVDRTDERRAPALAQTDDAAGPVDRAVQVQEAPTATTVSPDAITDDHENANTEETFAPIIAASKQASDADDTDIDPNVQRLIQLLVDSDPEERKNAVTQLSRRRSAAKVALPALLRALEDENPSVRIRAATAVWNLNQDSEAVTPVLIELLKEKQPGIPSMAAYLLGEIGSTASTVRTALENAMSTTSSLARVHIAEALAKIDPGDRRAIDALIELLRDPDNDVRWLATSALETAVPTKNPKVVRTLADALRDDDPRVRSTAALTLAAFGPAAKPAIPNLRVAMHEGDERLREAAGIALANIDSESLTGSDSTGEIQ